MYAVLASASVGLLVPLALICALGAGVLVKKSLDGDPFLLAKRQMFLGQ